MRWFPNVAVVAAVMSLMVSPASAADPVLLRGFEASTLHGAVRPVDDPGAPDGRAISLAGVATRRVALVTGSGLVVRLASSCVGAGLRVRLDGGPSLTFGAGSSAWHDVRLRLRITAGEHLIGMRSFPRLRGGCTRLRVERVDVATRGRGDPVLLGAAMRAQNLADDHLYAATFVANFDSLTPENELKMLFVEPQPGRYDFRAADALVSFARAHGKTVRGHTLVYGSQLPSWVTNPPVPWTRASLLAVMKDYIDTVMKHYGSQILTWDVVNEAFNDDGSFRDNVWYRVIGRDYVEQAFRFARAASPGAVLTYNDIAAETDDAKSRAILRMAADFRRRGVPLDAIGLQNHTNLFGFPRADILEATMSRYATLGLRVEITEMDVGAAGYSASPATGSQLQADAYRDAATACWDVAACGRLTTWGISDAVTWIGSAQAPLLFDSAYEPKPAFYAVRQALLDPR